MFYEASGGRSIRDFQGIRRALEAQRGSDRSEVREALYAYIQS